MKKKTKNIVVYSAILIVVLVVGYLLFSNKSIQTMPSGLQITDEVVGTGDTAQNGQIVTVNYTGTLANGTKFDSSFDHGQPFSFPLGAGQVIKGWDEGILGMKVGGKRKLVIPPELAYGSQNVGNGLIPPNSTLIFEVELLGVQPQ
ncbi:MAG: Peptidyl-prolyl cis-trans isomerase [Candidatus Jorgensenbacteria bacterium GW2011_GWA1_48_11]|uniref:Peptidyl-prolyl cis-trans isomerase n=1 Tax=Candidatus Jorgensenbacteria bacterium GW2011_GWA1_48_11 TaxID=1618660 RepID=A0A0G1XA19_9BACT|nr:MAG: Peptidyl-prolyl cis-trans isomerase [Candidatus Jorgensenbacteria bacterium GW2011_GWA1_48_11]KKW11861.1 MAG: Peptidyl-prolyl cis-trans isomerase [Candidatus Jorgensenbacteria bacterium GW2011_GWB1_49_9]